MAVIDTVIASPDNRAGIHAVSDGLEITKRRIPTENTRPPNNEPIITPVILPLIIAHASEEPTKLSVVINVPINAAAPTPVHIKDPHCSALFCDGTTDGIAAAGADADIL